MDEDVEAALMQAGHQINALAANERRLIDELAALRKDAERYRYYRARAYKDGATLAIDVGVIDDVAIGDFGEFIDAKADAALASAAVIGAA